MSTIIKKIEQFRRHVTINFNFDFEVILPHIRKTERKYIKSVIGADQYKIFAQPVDADTVQEEVFNLLEEASANLALFAYTFIGVIQISDKGFHISNNQHSTPAEWWQIRDLRRSLLNTGNEAIDEALGIMETDPNAFENWRNSANYTHFTAIFTRKTADFQRYFNIESSRLTFLKLRPHLVKVEDKYFDTWLDAATKEKIKIAATAETKKALQLAQAAQVSLCIAEIAREGAFLFTPNGLSTFITEIPGEKKTGLSVSELENLSRVKAVDGQEYIKKLNAHLRAYPLSFPEHALNEKAEIQSQAHNTRSTVSF